MNRDGFTLVELLVGMAILGILMALILNLQSTTIQYSTQQTSNAQRLQAINDVAGYVGAQVRAAQNVPDGLTINGSTCSRAGTVPCLAVILPVVETSAPTGCTRLPGTVIDWRLHAYRYIPRASIAATDRTPLPGLDSTAYGLQEIRVASGAVLLDSNADGCWDRVDTPPTTYSGTVSTGLLADNLILPATGTAAFEYTAATRVVTLRLRSVSQMSSGTTQYTLKARRTSCPSLPGM
ncbi:type II secretion system protein J [Deinococcus malanensis]|uniref:PulJ/GspJ family protein n=1 Tax=Deinococcus malanensis TaxID=1706855 RepID=UPI003624AD3F